MLVSKALEAFLLSYRGSKSPETSVWYERRLSSLVLFVGDMEIARVTIHDLRLWRVMLAERAVRYEEHPTRAREAGGLSTWTLHGYVRAARRFFRWLWEEGLIESNPALRLELPQLPRRPRLGITQADVDKMLAAAAVSGPRDLALVWCLYSTACRVAGLAHLCLGDLDLERGRARVIEKGDKIRTVYLVQPAISALLAWLAQRPASEDDHVFMGKRGPLTTNGIYQVLKRLAQAAGVTENWNPHNWRHGTARKLQGGGMPTGLLAQVLGHDDIQVTVEFYGTATEDELQAAHARYFQLPHSQGD